MNEYFILQEAKKFLIKYKNSKTIKNIRELEKLKMVIEEIDSMCYQMKKI